MLYMYVHILCHIGRKRTNSDNSSTTVINSTSGSSANGTNGVISDSLL